MRMLNTVILVAAFAFTGCSAIGPTSIHHDRFDYNEALSNSWKEQTLLNIVRLRYLDMPIFLEVASIVSGYTLEGSVNLTGNISSDDTVQGDFLTLGTGGKYTDRPTTTYVPVTGEKFHQSFMTPVPPKLLLFLTEAGWPIELVLPLTIDALNGMRGRKPVGKWARDGNQDFYRAIRLLSEVQESGSMALRIVKEGNDNETVVIFFYKEDVPPEIQERRDIATELLGVESEDDQVTVRYGLLPQADDEVALLTRSLLQMMIALSHFIEVPESDVEKGYTYPIVYQPGPEEEKLGKLMSIKSGPEKPEVYFVAVRYKSNWFWIDEADLNSKRTFTFLMVLFSIMESEESEGLPLITIPAG